MFFGNWHLTNSSFGDVLRRLPSGVWLAMLLVIFLSAGMFFTQRKIDTSKAHYQTLSDRAYWLPSIPTHYGVQVTPLNSNASGLIGTQARVCVPDHQGATCRTLQRDEVMLIDGRDGDVIYSLSVRNEEGKLSYYLRLSTKVPSDMDVMQTWSGIQKVHENTALGVQLPREGQIVIQRGKEP